MGIYLALGERKEKIALQLLLETLFVSFFAITIAVFTGNILAKNISYKMLKNQLNEQNSNIEIQSIYDTETIVDNEEMLVQLY